MGKIKKIVDSASFDESQYIDIYPVTSTKAVYDENNKRLDNILEESQNKFSELELEQIQGGVYDISAHNNNAVFKSLQALLSSSNLSTLIPMSVRHGGMSIRFVQSSDNKYVQWRLVSKDWSTDVNNWVAENEDFRNRVMQEVNTAVASIKPIVIEGNVTNAPDEEDITTDESNLLKFANRGTLHGMGYVILRKDKTFAEQVTQANTIYEIRYDFDLGGAALTLPNNITLRYIGGVIKNGTVKGSGLKTMDMPKEQKVLPVFAEGVNFDDNELIASHIGMIEGDIESSINDDILDQVIASGKNLRLDGHFRFNKTHYLDGALSIRGGSLYSKSILFTMREGSSITLEDVTISLGVMYLINCVGNLDYIIDSITVNRCTFKGETSFVKFYGADVPYITQPHGLRRFVVKDSYIDVTASFIVLSDLCVTEEFAFIGNVVRNMKYSIIQLGENNDYTNTNDKTDYWADILFEGNDIRGVVSTNGTSYLTPLVSDGQKRVFFRNNVISNIIGTSGQVCYECYASCDEYYCENNVCKNIVHLPSSGTVNTPSEIFKSKASGSLRKAYANRWEIDFAECRDLCRNVGVEWTDEAFANISFISLFQFVGVLGTLDFCDNTIIIKNGRLRLSNSSFSVKEALFKRNNLDIAEVESERNYLIPVWGKGIERITIQCNNFNVHNGYIVLAGGYRPADSFRNVIVEDNITNFNNFVSEVRSGYDLYVKNNKVLRNEKLDSSPYFILSSNNKINGESFNYFSAGVKAFYIPKLTNVSWKCNIKHEPSASSFLSLRNNNVNKDSSGDYDIIIEADGQKIGYKVRYSDTKMIAYDEWDNILVSSPKVITSSGDWVTVYNSISTQIIFHPDIELGMMLQICSLTEDVGYRNIHIASPKYGIIQPIIANTYTKGAYRFDRTLGKPVWWNGTKWIDATGADV